MSTLAQEFADRELLRTLMFQVLPALALASRFLTTLSAGPYLGPMLPTGLQRGEWSRANLQVHADHLL